MRISDWSSDVCSSDLLATAERTLRVTHGEGLPGFAEPRPDRFAQRPVDVPIDVILGKPPRMERDVGRQIIDGIDIDVTRSEERRVGNKCVISCRYRMARHH